MHPITVVILTKNNEATIDRCLASIRWCPNIIVVDDYSTDRTLSKLSRSVRVYKRRLKGDFAAQRNYALSHVETDWALFVDADEEISQALATEIQKTVLQTRINGFFIPRVDILWGKQMRYGEFLSFTILRLGRVGKGRWVGKVHETWEIDGRVDYLHNSIFHNPQGGIRGLLKKMNEYSSYRADELYQKNVKASFLSIMLYPVGKFVHLYFLKLGLLDGMRGLLSATSMSFYSFLVRGKLWQLHDQTKK